MEAADQNLGRFELEIVQELGGRAAGLVTLFPQMQDNEAP
jgi:hypothetical protein